MVYGEGGWERGERERKRERERERERETDREICNPFDILFIFSAYVFSRRIAIRLSSILMG